MLKNVLATLAFLVVGQVFAIEADSVLAEANGVRIMKSEFLQAYRQTSLVVTNKKVTKEDVLNQLIDRALGIARAKKENLSQDPTVQRKMEDILYHAQISQELEPLLKKITVSDDDVKDYYKKFPEYRTAHILFRLKAIPDAKEEKESLQKAVDIYTQIRKDPNRFAEYADKYSHSIAGPAGGDMGFQPAAVYAPEYFSAIKGKTAGFISGPVKTQFGLHIIKVIAVKDFKDINTDMYKKFVYDEKRDALIGTFMADQRKKANIRVNAEKLTVE